MVLYGKLKFNGLLFFEVCYLKKLKKVNIIFTFRIIVKRLRICILFLNTGSELFKIVFVPAWESYSLGNISISLTKWERSWHLGLCYWVKSSIIPNVQSLHVPHTFLYVSRLATTERTRFTQDLHNIQSITIYLRIS